MVAALLAVSWGLLPALGSWLLSASVAEYAGPPPAAVLAGITAAASLLVVGAVIWIATGSLRLEPRATALLSAGMAVLTVQVVGVNTAAVWARDYTYDTNELQPSGGTAQQAWDVLQHGGPMQRGLFASRDWAPIGSQAVGLMAAAFACAGVLVVLALLRHVSQERSMTFAAAPQRATTGAGTVRAALALSSAALCGALLLGATAADPGTLASVMLITGGTLVVLAIFAPRHAYAAELRRDGGWLTGVTAAALMCAVSTLWFPVVYLLGAGWPVRITPITLVGGGGK